MKGELIFAIDPGTTESGWVLFESARDRVLNSGVESNGAILEVCGDLQADVLAVEMIASYGMAVGKEVFETCLWIGRFDERWRSSAPGETVREVEFVYRRDVKQYLCGTMKAKDANIRQALIDKIGPQGTKKSPGPTYGIKSHAWAALAVAVTVAKR